MSVTEQRKRGRPKTAGRCELCRRRVLEGTTRCQAHTTGEVTPLKKPDWLKKNEGPEWSAIYASKFKAGCRACGGAIGVGQPVRIWRWNGGAPVHPGCALWCGETKPPRLPGCVVEGCRSQQSQGHDKCWRHRRAS